MNIWFQNGCSCSTFEFFTISWHILCKENQSLISLERELSRIVTRTGETSLGKSLENLRISRIFMLFEIMRSFATSANGMSVGM